MMSQENGGNGQEPTAGPSIPGREPSTTGEQQHGSEGGAAQPPSLDAITDPSVRSYVEAQLRDAQEARAEAARYRTQLRSVEAEVQQHRQANETEAQRAQRERDEIIAERDRLRDQMRDLMVGTAVREALAAAKAFNPATAARALDMSKIALDDDGRPVQASLDQAIQALRQSDPYLFQRVNTDASAASSESLPSASINDLIRTLAGRPPAA